MTSHRFPILIWQDYEGCFTACVVEREDVPAGIGATADEAVAQVKEYLSWLYRESPWLPAPDFLEPELTQVKVEVRPEYRVDNRIYPCEEKVIVRVACVHGRQESGLFVGAAPILDLRFYYYEPGALRDLVVRYAQERMRGLSPRALSRYLPPRSVALDDVVITVAQAGPARVAAPAPAVLGAVAEPLGDRSLRSQFSRAWERDAELADLVRRLSAERANVILAGESGVGKTSLLVEAVRRIERQADESGEVERDEHPRKFWMTNGARLIAGMRYLGQWEGRCEAMIDELGDLGGVLCAENLLDLVRTGGGDPSASIAAFLLPYLQRGELRLVAEATPQELDACRRLLPGFADVFQILNVPAFDRERALAALGRVASTLEQNVHVAVPAAAIELVYRLFRRFMPYQVFPGASVAFLREVVERASLERATGVTLARVIEHFVRQTGLPELFLRDEVPLDVEQVAAEFRAQVIGQEGPCRTAADLVATFKAGLNDPNRPVGVLLFCGPTGVGKTELAKAIARAFFGHGETTDRMVRLDMSEYGSPGSAARLAAGPDGRPSDVVERVRRQPFTMLLLDEIEKAAPEAFDVLLSVFDEGRLTDRYGRTTTFRSAIILMTSNIGAATGEAIGFGAAGALSYESEAMAWFRPEFFNRIDAVVSFSPLTREVAAQIARKELAEIASREGLEKSNLQLAWSEALVEYVAREGFDARYGARPLQRTIEALVVAPLARFLLEHRDLRSATLRAEIGASGAVEFEQLAE